MQLLRSRRAPDPTRAEVFSDIHDIYCEHGSHGSIATVHEIDMPRVLRDAIGTHWLLPGSLTFTEPTKKPVTLYSPDVKRLVLALFSKGSPIFDYQEDANAVFNWAEYSESEHPTVATNWDKLLAVLSNSTAASRDCVSRSKGGAAFVQ